MSRPDFSAFNITLYRLGIFRLFCVPDIIMKTNSLSNSIIIMAFKGVILNGTECVDLLVQGVFGLFTFLYSRSLLVPDTAGHLQ